MLNAFRHQRNKQPRKNPCRRQSIACAQRLSASTEQTAKIQVGVQFRRECSTPFGINGTNRRRGRPVHVASGCAQRLSASTEQTVVNFSGIGYVCQLCSTPFGINGTNSQWTRHESQTKPVLNAFRHQRNKQLNARSFVPIGCTVLNAFRHQRNKQRRSMFASSKVGVCSTPFGINGTNRKTAGYFPVASFSAQRLSASTEQTDPSGTGTTPSRSTVLNAFRHQRNKQTSSFSIH